MEELYNEKKAKKNFRGRKLDDKGYKKNGVPGWTRTNGPLINSQMLWPAELRRHAKEKKFGNCLFSRDESKYRRRKQT